MTTPLDLNRPASTEEIAAALGLSKRSAERKANKGKWPYSELATHSRHKKRVYALKDLPKDIMNAVLDGRLKPGVCDEYGSGSIGRGNFEETGAGGGYVGAVEAGAKPGAEHLAVSAGDTDDVKKRHGGQAVQASVQSNTILLATRRGAEDAGLNRAAQGVLGANPKRRNGSDLVDGHDRPANHSLQSSDDKQRLTDESRQYLLQFVANYPGSDNAACAYLTQGYAAGTLTPELDHALKNCNDKVNDKRIGKLSASTLSKWKRLKKDTGHCLPAKTRVKDDWQSTPWLALFLSCYRKPQKPHQSEAYAEFKKDWAVHGFSPAKLPSYSAINRVLKRVPPLVREAGRCTGSELAAMKAFVRRDWSQMSSNEVWVGDGHSFKAKVRHPDHGQAFAPEVTVIIDARSRFIVGWAFSLSENQIAVSEALGQGMIKHGKPLIYYSDNGSGQTAKTIDHPMGGMLARLGVEHKTGIPGNAQGRGIIEGLWDITAIAVAKTFPTFQGTGMDGDSLRKVTNLINSAKRKGEVPALVPTWQAFMLACEERFDTYNHEHKHSALGGLTPAEVYFANFDPTWACPLTDEEILTLYRPFVERMPTRGEVRLFNNLYFNKQLVDLPGKTKVRVAYDLHHADHVWISDLDGRFICMAIWNGNQVDGFAKSYTEQLKDNRVEGIVKREQVKIDAAYKELGYDLEGEVLTPVPVIFREPEPELIEVPIPFREPEVALKAPVLPGHFNKQDEEVMGSYQDTVMALYKDKTGND